MRSGNTIVVIRSVIAVLFVALAVANFVSGRVVFGVLFVALAVMNVVMTVYVRRRRAQFARRFPGFADWNRR
jgi:Flp pilus assembly protein TadB